MNIRTKDDSPSFISWSIVIGVIIALFTFNAVNWDSLLIEVHDNLDSVHAWLAILSQHDLFFSSNDTAVPFLGGINRGYLPSELQLANIIYHFFDPLSAHYINYALKVIIGTFSFYVLGHRIFGSNPSFKDFGPIVALAFALLPGYENLFIAQASVPLAVYLYLRALERKNLSFFFLPLFYPVLSEFPRYGIFICAITFLCTLYLIFRRDPRWLSSFIFLSALSLGYLITDYRVFYTMLISGEETIRASMVSPDYNIIKGSLKVALMGQYHAQSLHHFIILPSLLISLYIARKEVKIPYSSQASFAIKLLISCLVIISFHSLIYGFYGSYSIKSLIVNLVPALAGFNFSRFIWLNPTLWYIAFSAALLIMSRSLNKWFVIGISCLQLFLIVMFPTYGNDIANTIKCRYFSACENTPSYEEFYSVNLFNNIKSDINYSGEAVLAFGFHPSVLSFNGFYTLDGYHNAYSSLHKRNFRKIIAPTLDSSEKYREYFDNWGGRAYLFSEQVDYRPKRNIENLIAEIPFDPIEAKKSGVVYIISLYRLNISQTNRIKFISEYNKPQSFYNIYLYKLK